MTDTWRFHVNEHDGTISRGRLYRLSDSDTWLYYWDGDGQVAFYDEGYRGIRALTENEDTERAMAAYRLADEYDSDRYDALTRLARRLTDNYDADFICVGLDRGMDLYALSWNGPNPEWRDEIEAVWNGDVYRIEVEEYDGGWPGGWRPADDICGEWYGEDKAEAGWEREFPLAEFPAERVLSEAGV